MAASDPTPYVATPTGTLQGVAAFSWDGAAWQPSVGAGPDVATPTGVLQGVAAFNGGPAWQPVGRGQPGVATPTGVLDGVAVYTWSGSAWVPQYGGPSCSTPSGVLRAVAAFNWDGSAWQPAAQARASVPTPYGVLDGVAMFNWTGSAWAAVGAPSLSLDFTSGTLDPRITFTRASTATYFDSSGVMQTAATNAPRFDYDPVTHALRGMPIEEARTNLLLNSATLGTQSVTTTAVATTLSFYGTGTVTMSGTSTAGPLTGSGAFPQRVSLTFTPTAGTLTLTVTGSVLNAQLEAGGFVTSYIPTAAAAATRTIEVCQIPTAGWYNPTTYSLMFELDLPVENTTYGGICDATFGNATYLGNSAWIRSGSTIYTGVPRVTVGGATNKLCGAINAGVLSKICVNGGTAVQGTVVGAAQTTATRLAIGNDPWSLTTAFSGHMRRVRYWPRVLSDAEMQSVTA